jgi:hypothetical protein
LPRRGAAPAVGARAYLELKMLGDLVARNVERVIGQRPDELLGLAANRLVCEGEADTEGERINVGQGTRRGVANVSLPIGSTRRCARVKPSRNE